MFMTIIKPSCSEWTRTLQRRQFGKLQTRLVYVVFYSATGNSENICSLDPRIHERTTTTIPAYVRAILSTPGG